MNIDNYIINFNCLKRHHRECLFHGQSTIVS